MSLIGFAGIFLPAISFFLNCGPCTLGHKQDSHIALGYCIGIRSSKSNQPFRFLVQLIRIVSSPHPPTACCT
ncbi:uncharacterized protein B0J16DRAFT_346196 [Fusarium flagelliforme]|uniref:uncharacterized protein n=1 Tax=Fusarium flagelliforme TaxID=2675880 RepID=UPI001E8D4902|nr:uncharacterized protein B0J16DRAFT_346196 [Fusarium flagelliforme]KAH7179020.1 hypothetical protein B0J16DRAFT_346196 [Fusarium flagelliforme]